jgi:hypothetical protein
MVTAGLTGEVRVVVYLTGGGNCAFENWGLRMARAKASNCNCNGCYALVVYLRRWFNGCQCQCLTMVLESDECAASWLRGEVYGYLLLLPTMELTSVDGRVRPRATHMRKRLCRILVATSACRQQLCICQRTTNVDLCTRLIVQFSPTFEADDVVIFFGSSATKCRTCHT